MGTFELEGEEIGGEPNVTDDGIDADPNEA